MSFEQFTGPNTNWYDFLDPRKGLTQTSQDLGINDFDPNNPNRAALQSQIDQSNQLAQGARGFGDTAAQNYNGVDTNNLNQSRQYLQDLATGKNSVSALQLQQGLQSNLAAQRSMAAGAAPQNSAAAARNAANNAARLGYGYSGQQALAGLQERNQAQQQLSGLDLSRRGQDLQGFGAGYGAANQAYANSMSGYGTMLGNPQKTTGDILPGIVSGVAAGATKSDERAKTDISEADKKSRSIVDGLRAYSYKYKDAKDGKGEQYGVMAQDLERAGLKHAVIDTPKGKYVDSGKAATSALGLVAALGRRVADLEKTKGASK